MLKKTQGGLPKFMSHLTVSQKYGRAKTDVGVRRRVARESGLLRFWIEVPLVRSPGAADLLVEAEPGADGELKAALAD